MLEFWFDSIEKHLVVMDIKTKRKMKIDSSTIIRRFLLAYNLRLRDLTKPRVANDLLGLFD
jgi:hypothetical protein